MMPWFVWKGKNSLADFGLWIGKLPKRVKPEERNEQVEIPGRAGSLFMLEGEDIYSPYSAEMTVVARNTLQMDKIVDWLRGSSDLILCTDTGKARSARIVGEVAFERDGNNLQQAVIPFVFQPFRKQINPATITVTNGNETIHNLGDVASKPIVHITTYGDAEITIAEQKMVFSNVEDTIKVDCDAQIITKTVAEYGSEKYYYKDEYAIFEETEGGQTIQKLYRFDDSGIGDDLVSGGHLTEITNWNGLPFDYIWTGIVAGEYWKIPKGQSTVTKNIPESIVIEPNWRWL